MSGLFGVYDGKTSACLDAVLYGTDYHTHMFPELVGVAVRRSVTGFWHDIHDISTEGTFRDRFRKNLKSLKADLEEKEESADFALGAISDHDAQPLTVSTRLGDFAIAGEGNIHNLKELSDKYKNKQPFIITNPDQDDNSIELATRIIFEADDVPSGIEKFWSEIEGSMSLMLVDKLGKMYAARSARGVSVLNVGKKADSNGFAVASESFALQKGDYEPYKYLLPGEIVSIDKTGLKVLKEGCQGNCNVCLFKLIYSSFPASIIEGVEVEMARNGCGEVLGRLFKGEAQRVVGLPDSGLGHAVGVIVATSIPPGRHIVKYTPSWPRSFGAKYQKLRELIAEKKIIFCRHTILKYTIIVIVDDSIVRGTQLSDLLSYLRELGVTEIHLLIACPPLMYPCIYLRSTRTQDELAARRAIKLIEGRDIEDVTAYLDPTSPQYAKMIEKITQQMNADSLIYNTLPGMIEGVGISESDICTYCWTGKKIQYEAA